MQITQLTQSEIFVMEAICYESPSRYVLLTSNNTFWTKGGFSAEYPDAWEFTDEIEACREADRVKAKHPNLHIAVWVNYGMIDENEIYQGRRRATFRYRDNEHVPELGDVIDVHSANCEPEQAEVVQCGKNKLKVHWGSEFIKPKSAWVMSADCDLIARAG